MYSRYVKPHLRHRKNCVDDSSDPRVCTCQTLAVLFPHLGQSICSVGNMVNCSSLPMTATSCFGVCSKILPLTKALLSDSCFLNWHLVHANMTRACLPEFTFLGTSLEPHSAQNSIKIHLAIFSKKFFGK